MSVKPFKDSRTKVYIDGYNLYYGCLKGTHYKWLDLKNLIQKEIIPSITVEKNGFRVSSIYENGWINYFTATIIESAAKSIDSVSSQARYHRALSLHLGQEIEIIEGYYALNKMSVPIVDADDPEKLPKDCDKIQAWKLEEKQTDVNIAIHAYHDAVCGEIDHAVFVTNDTDISTALKFIKRHTSVTVGLIIPTRDSERRPNKALVENSDWSRNHIKDSELKNSQLPDLIPGKRKPVSKPESWYPNFEIFKEVLDTACLVRGSRRKALQWMNSNHPPFEEKTPLELIETSEGADFVLSYVRDYVRRHLKES